MAPIPDPIPPPIAGLPPDTGQVFRTLAGVPAISAFVLVGGTAMALQCRHRLSEDLDFWHFMRAGRRIEEIVSAAQAVTSIATAERAVAVLRGDWPLDGEDEGFYSLSPDITLEQIRADFCAWTDAYEQERARNAARGN